MTELVYTNKERVRMHEDQRIAEMYREMVGAYPNATQARIIRSIAASGKFKSKSFAGIRQALVRAQAITPKKRNKHNS